MDVVGRLAEGREIGAGDFADITSVAATSVEWADDGQLCVTFASDLTPVEQQRVRLRITSSPGDEAMRVALAAYLTVDTPTGAQTVAALKRTIRLVLSLGE